MPRDGSGVYSQPYPDVVSGTTIESAKYNGNVNDVEQDLNLPRPIVAGGTGANNAHDAMIALSGEIAGQVVTNYDSFPFVDGSFSSAPGATSAPAAGSYFVGICYGAALGIPTLEAQNASDVLVPHAKYIRSKVGGTWGAWKQQAGSTADLDAAYVNVTGDTMTGTLNIQYSSSNSVALGILNSYAGAHGWILASSGGGPSPLGTLCFYDQTVGGAVGWFRNDGLSIASTTASTSPTTGALTVAGGVGVGGTIVVGGNQVSLGTTSNCIWFSAGSNNYWRVAGDYYFQRADGLPYATIAANTGNVTLNSGTASTSPTTGALTVGGGLGVAGIINAGGNVQLTGSVSITAPSGANPYVLFNNSAGTLVSYTYWDTGTGQHKLYAGAGLFVFDQAGQAYKAGGGAWGTTSDARIKNDLGDYPRGLAEIVSLRPVTYTYKGNDTPVAPAHAKGDENSKLPLTVPYPNSDHAGAAKAEKKFAGLIAQEVEAIFPEMVSRRSAFIDGVAVDDLRDLDTTPLIFALINAVKELKARVEELEAA